MSRNVLKENADGVNARLFISYLNNLIGISDPNLLNPPDFCPDLDAEMDGREEPVNFLNVFFGEP